MEIIATGSIAYDYLMRFPGRFVEHIIPEELHQVSLSFLVDDMTRHWGGVAANIAYSMALLGLRPKLMGTVGRDFSDYRKRLESVGVDTSTVIQIEDDFTASFFVNTDLDNNQIASFYAGAMGQAGEYSIADVYEGKPDLVIISPNAPKAMLKLAEECQRRGIRFVYDPSQQVPRLSGEELRRSMHGAYMMIVNAYEAHIIQKKTGMTLNDLRDTVELLIITQGEDGALIYTDGEIIEVPIFPVETVKDPTGVGDAFRAGFIRGIAAELPLRLAGQMGALCAAYVLEQVGTQNHRFTVEEFVERFRTQFDDGGKLDVLLEARSR